MADPVVVHTLGVLGVTHQTTDVQATIDLKLVADHAHYGDVFTRPVGLLKDLVPIDLAPLDLLDVRFTALEGLQELHLEHLVLGGAVKRGDVPRVQVQRLADDLDVEVFGNPDRIAVKPLGQVLVTHAQRLQSGDRGRVRVHPFVLSAGDVFGDEAPPGVRAAGVLDQRIHVDAEAVANPTDLEVLVEGLVVAVFGQDTDVALTIRDLVLTGGVVGDIGIADVLDVPHHAVEDLGDLDIALVVSGDDLTRGAVLALVVGDLPDVLGQLVDGQRGPSIDRLALNRPSGR